MNATSVCEGLCVGGEADVRGGAEGNESGVASVWIVEIKSKVLYNHKQLQQKYWISYFTVIYLNALFWTPACACVVCFYKTFQYSYQLITWDKWT